MIEINLEEKINLLEVDMLLGSYGCSDGILPKGVSLSDDKKWFIKLGSYSKVHGFYGVEPMIELINSRIGNILGLPVLEYDLKRVLVTMQGETIETIATQSKDYKAHGEKSVSFEKMYECMTKNLTALEFVKQLGVEKQIYSMFVYDYIICNLDRHGKNIEILIHKDKIRLAPLFDNSLTFLTNRPVNEIVNKVDFNDSMCVNNYIGHRTLLENLMLIDEPISIRKPTEKDREKLFQGLSNVTTKEFRDYVWYLLNRRVEDVKSKQIQFIRWY